MNENARKWNGVFLAIAILTLGGCVEENGNINGQEQSENARAATSSGIEESSEELQIGMLTVGPVSDWGFNYQHNQGRLGMEARLRDDVDTVLAENIPENVDASRVMERMASSGTDLIIATSYGYADMVERTAEKYPETYFVHTWPTLEPGANLATCAPRVWEGAYVSGVVAAASLPEETHYGFLAAHPIPPINWTVNAFLLGAKSVNPGVSIDIVYTNSWYDPAAETEATKSLIAKGAKVIYVLTDSPVAGVQTAERGGVYSLAHFADLSDFAKEGWLTGTIWEWSQLYMDVAQQVVDGNWEAKTYAGGFDKGYVDIAPFGPAVPDDARVKAREVIEGIASGEVHVFAGPIRDADGQVRVSEGEVATVEEISSMDWVVEGVRGAPSNQE